MPGDNLRSMYVRDRINLERYPELSKNHIFDKQAQITIGDLHGNTLKLIYFLLKHRVIRLSQEDFLNFARLYKKDLARITADDLAWFQGMVERIDVSKKKGTIRLIGDDLSDRGSNDYYTLKILQKLFRNNVNVEVMLSNHVGEFIEAHETRDNYFPQGLRFSQACSMGNMNILIQRGLINKDEVKEIVNREYLPHLKLLSYTIDSANNRISIYTHAPNGLETIRALAHKLNVNYKDGSIQELARTIEAINHKFTRNYVNHGRIHQLFEQGWDQDNIDPIRFPLAHLMWNRNYEHLERPAHHHGFQLKFIHGHDSAGVNIRGRFYNLDNDLGKQPGFFEGMYNVHYTHERPLTPHLANQLEQNAQNRGIFYFSPWLKTALFATAFAGVSSLAYSLIAVSTFAIGAAAWLGVLSILTLRNYLYDRKANDLIQQHRAHRNQDAAVQELERVFELGQAAGNSWTAWAKSFVDLSAWQNARTFGGGMMRPAVNLDEPEVPERRRRRRVAAAAA